MYEQFLYYWFVWMIIIIVTFLMKNGKKRSFLLIWLLLMVAISQTYFWIDSIQIYYVFIILLVGALIFYVHHTVSTYHFFVTFSIMAGYTSLLIWEIITPVWFFMPSYFLIPVILVVFTTFLIPSFYQQISVILVGMSFGQMIFEFLLIVYSLNNIIGKETLFIHINVAILFLIVLNFLNGITLYFSNYFRKKLL